MPDARAPSADADQFVGFPRHALGVLKGVTGVSFTFFDARDVVRHPLVQRIVQAYEARGDAP